MAGRMSARSMPIIVTAIKSSINVKARLFLISFYAGLAGESFPTPVTSKNSLG